MEETEKEQAKPESTPAPELKKKELPPESPLNRFLVRAMRWLLGFLVVAGLGALLVIFTLYLPLRQKLQASQAEMDQTNQRVAELQGNVENLTTQEKKTQDLQAQLDEAELHVAILSARADIAAAQLALAQNDAVKARLAISKTGETLKKLEGMLKPGEQKLATDMQSRLDLAMKGIADNPYAAASDLDVLSAGLIELENTYFAKP
jgi:TolA-binding protein